MRTFPVAADLAVAHAPARDLGWARFDPGGYRDILYDLTGGQGANAFEVDSAVSAACQAMYAGAAIPAELAALQTRLDALVQEV